MTDVFISYKTEDRARVRPLVDALTAEGLDVWWDVHIQGGAAWRETIRGHLEAASCVIVVWSDGAVGPAGHFVQDEAAYAKRRGVYLPVAVDPVEPPLGFGQEQALKLIGWRGSRRDPLFTDVLAAARAVIEGGPRPRPVAQARSIRLAALRPWRIGAMAVVGGLLASGVVIVAAPSQLCALTGLACAAPTAANSIAVLPLANLAADPTQDYFADGLTEELIGSLARLGQFQVVGRTSSFKFKGSHETSAAIGQKLHVSYLIDGSVRRAGDIVRVSAVLVDAKTGFERWSQTYDRKLDDAFAVQSGIAQAVAEALRVRLMGADVAALSGGGTTNGEAYDAYLRGRELIRSAPGESGLREALARFDAAIADDATFASAYAWRAIALSDLADQFTAPGAVRATYDSAEVSARQAVALDPNLPLGQAALGLVLYRGRLDFPHAQGAFARAMRTGSGDVIILSLFGQFSDAIGDVRAGLAAHQRAAFLDPLDPLHRRQLGYGQYSARRYGEAIETMRQALALNPHAGVAHAVIGNILYLTGDLTGARREYALEPLDYLRAVGEAILLHRQGDAKGADTALRGLAADPTTAYQQAQVFAQWGAADRAFEAIDRAFAIGDSGLATLRTDPLIDPLRGDPRFAARLARLGGAG